MSKITRESFIKYSNKIIEDGFKICPCCLSSKLEFMTDEEHTEYELRCKLCGVGVRDHIFSRIRKNWNHRSINIKELNDVTHDINCTWWDTEKAELVVITLEEG